LVERIRTPSWLEGWTEDHDQNATRASGLGGAAFLGRSGGAPANDGIEGRPGRMLYALTAICTVNSDTIGWCPRFT
jgi:hypothetical protein